MIAPGECPRVPQPVGNDEDPGWRQGRLIHLVDDEAQEHLIITPPSSEIAPAASTATHDPGEIRSQNRSTMTKALPAPSRSTSRCSPTSTAPKPLDSTVIRESHRAIG
jgi:hypothetical protein